MFLVVLVQQVIEDLIVQILAGSKFPAGRPHMVDVCTVGDEALQIPVGVEQKHGTQMLVDLCDWKNGRQVKHRIGFRDAGKSRVSRCWMPGVIDKSEIHHVDLMSLPKHKGAFLQYQNVACVERLRRSVINDQDALLVRRDGQEQPA